MSQKREVIKHSSAIQISNEVSLLQRRAWNVLLANAYDDLPEKEIYEVKIRELAEFLNFDSKNLEYLKETLRSLNKAQVEWNVLKKDGLEWGVFTLLSSARIINGVCHYAYDPHLRRQLHNPAMYAKINLSLQNTFNSKHTLALYELAVDYYRVQDQHGETPYIPIEKFRKLLGLKEREYAQFKDLNKKIIKKALLEINKKSDLFIEVSYKREKRRVAAVKFIIKRNKENAVVIKQLERPRGRQLSLPIDDFGIDNQGLLVTLINEFGVSKNKAIHFLKNFDEHYIKEVLVTVRENIEAGKVKDVPAFTVKAIQDDYRPKKTPATIAEEEKKKEAGKAKAEKKKKEEELDKKLETESANNKKADQIFEELPAAEKKKLEKLARSETEKEYKPNNPAFEMMVRFNLRKTVLEKN